MRTQSFAFATPLPALLRGRAGCAGRKKADPKVGFLFRWRELLSGGLVSSRSRLLSSRSFSSRSRLVGGRSRLLSSSRSGLLNSDRSGLLNRRFFFLATSGNSQRHEGGDEERLLHCWFPLSIKTNAKFFWSARLDA